MDSAAASARPDDEEARRRRSTDCIYYLASPLTCKKGSECEYRHSDAARMNPRDCWYWFNGNCTNPKCSFRHPPLDNLLGAPATPRTAQQSAAQVPVPAQAHGSATIASTGPGTAKQGVPCYYFQQGMCAKGVKCAFLHVPQAAGNSAPQPMQKVSAPALQPNPQLKNSWTKPDSSVQQNTASSMLDKSKVSTHDGKPTQKQSLTTRIDHSSRIYQKHSSSHAQSGSARHYQPQHSVKDDIAENGVEVGEFVREPSADSDVLVGRIDYESEQSFKGNHNSYHRTSGEQHTGMRRTHGSKEPERLYRGSSGDTLPSDKRISQKEPSNVTASSSDLRHRILKQRRLSNPISTQVPDRHDAYLEDCQRRRGNEQAAHDSLTRSRLHGRIKLPGETSFDRLDSRSDREKDRGPRARLSPPKHTDLRGKLHERLKARSNEDIPDNAKSSVKKALIGEDAGSLNFTGPKSLAELKAKKVLGSSGEDPVSSTASFVGLPRRTSETVGSRDSSESVPFEGPKPLSVILKRKREGTSADSDSRQEEDDPARVEGESLKLQIPESDPVEVDMEANGEEEDEGAFHPEDDMAYDDNFDGNADKDADKELEEPQDEDYNYDAAGEELEEPQDEDYDYDVASIKVANAVEDAGEELEEPQDEDYDYDVASIKAVNAVEDAGEELEEPQDEYYDYDAADINAGNAVEDADNELEEPQDEDYNYDASDINAGNAVEDAGKELDEPQDEDYGYDVADINASNAVEDAGKELEEPQDEDYNYDDVNADEDNDYQEYEDDDDLKDNDDFARKVGVIIS